MERNKKITNGLMHKYKVLNVVLDKEIQNEEIQHGPLPGNAENYDFEYLDPMDNNYVNKPRYYRELRSRKDVNCPLSSKWNQFVPSHIENMKYLVSKIIGNTQNENTANDSRSSALSLALAALPPLPDKKMENTPLHSRLNDNVLTEDFKFDDVQFNGYWEEDLHDYKLSCSIVDVF